MANDIGALVNKLGKKSKDIQLHYCFISFVGKDAKYHKLIKVKHIHSRATKICRLSKLQIGEQPFRYDPKFLIKGIVNKLGMYSHNKKDHYCFVSMAKPKKSGHIMVKIKNLQSKEIKKYCLSILKTNYQPFQYYIQEKEKKLFHPLIKRAILKNGYMFIYETSIVKRGSYVKHRPDFIVINPTNNKKVILEAKHDLTSHGKNIVQNNIQINKYHRAMSNDENYKRSLVVSTHGKSGFTLDMAMEEIKNMIGQF